MATKAQRDARLDELLKATSDWERKRLKEIEDRVASSKKILKGRTGAERLTNTLVSAGTALLVDEISEFLLG